MKVWFDHQVFTIQRYGGVSRYFVELLRALRSIEGIDADVIAPAHVNEYLSPGDTQHSITFRLRKPSRGVRYRPAITAPIFRMAAWLGRPDVVHETHYGLGGKHLPRDLRVVTTCHDMVFEKFPHFVPNAADQVARKLMTFERADAIVCISAHTRTDLLERYPFLESKVSIVHHGVDRTPAPAHLPIALPKPYLLYVGMRQGYKNFSGLIRALGASRILRENFHLLCFGGGALSAEELSQIKAAGFPPERIHSISGGDTLLAYIYQHATAFIFPSFYEGFGMPLTEAMVHGCPIACSSASCFPEICADAAAYFDPHDTDSIRDCIKTLVDSGTLKQLSARGSKRVEQYSWARCATETAATYRRIV